MKSVRMFDIARRAGVSVKQVSRAIRGESGIAAETRKRVLRAARALGYAGLPGGRNRRIAVLCDPVNLCALTIIGELHRLNWEAVLMPLADFSADFEGFFDGAFYVNGNGTTAPAWYNRFTLPLVTVNDYGWDPERIASVMPDADHEMELAVDHLAELGHRRIARLRSKMPGGGEVYRHRGETGFLQAAARHGIADEVATLNFVEWPELETLIPDLCRRGFTGFIITIYRDYGWLLDIFRQVPRRIPQEVSLIVYDDQPLVEDLGLTAVAINYLEMIRQAIRVLVDRIEGRDELPHLVIPASLRIRNSTGPLAATEALP